MGKKLTQQQVDKIFLEQNCRLIDTYDNARLPMMYICSCGSESRISLDNFKKGRRCKNCGISKMKSTLKHSYEKVSRDFSDKGCTLLSKEYINGHEILDYVCECGNVSKIRYFDFLKGKRCWNCKIIKLGNRDRLGYDYIREFFNKEGCILLSPNYINAHQKLDYKCSCGTFSNITFDKFRLGQRCFNCKMEKLSKENHYKYNPDLTVEEREIKRNYPEYRQWAKSVKERDNYTCQKCRQIGYKLVSHHIYGYRYHKDKRTDIDNGITLCDSCHKLFHSHYGYVNVNKEQFQEFMEMV